MMAAIAQTCFDFQKSLPSVKSTSAMAAAPTMKAMTIFTKVANPRKTAARSAHFQVNFAPNPSPERRGELSSLQR